MKYFEWSRFPSNSLIEIMNLTITVLILLSTYLLSCSALCVIKVSNRANCSEVPIFEGCLQTQFTVRLELARIYSDVINAVKYSEVYGAFEFVLNHKLKYQFSYDQLSRSMELQMFAADCCLTVTNLFHTVSYERTANKTCPTLVLNNVTDSSNAFPLSFELYIILIQEDVIIIRGSRFGIVFVNGQRSSNLKQKMSLLDRVSKPGMWFGINTRREIPKDSCNCSIIRDFTELFLEWRKMNTSVVPLIRPTSRCKSSRRNGTSITNSWNPPSSMLILILVSTMVVVLAALLIQDLGCHLRNNRVRPFMS